MNNWHIYFLIGTTNALLMILAAQSYRRYFSGEYAPPTPIMFMTRFKLWASTCRQAHLRAVPTCSSVIIWKCVALIQCFKVPNGCSTVWHRVRIFSGSRGSPAIDIPSVTIPTNLRLAVTAGTIKQTYISMGHRPFLLDTGLL